MIWKRRHVSAGFSQSRSFWLPRRWQARSGHERLRAVIGTITVIFVGSAIVLTAKAVRHIPVLVLLWTHWTQVCSHWIGPGQLTTPRQNALRGGRAEQ